MRRRVVLAGGLGLALLGACESDGPEPSGQLRIATGSTGAVYYQYGNALAKLVERSLPKVAATVLESNASKENVDWVLTDRAEIGFTQADIAFDAEQRAPGQLAALARIYDDYVHLVAAADSKIFTVADLRGRRVSVGGIGSGTAVTAERILDVTADGPGKSIVRHQLGLDPSVTALAAGEIDAFFFSGGLPVTAIGNLAKRVPIRLIALEEQVTPLRQRFGDYYAERLVPASTYEGITATVVVGMSNYLVVRATMAEPLAFAVTRLLFEGRDELAKAHQAAGRINIRSAISTPPLPLHPGSTRYYRTQKA